MPVTQISRIQVRRGPKDNIPQALAEGEMAMTTDTGEVFIGAPNLPKIAHRGGSIFPYQNIRLITEFDLVHTLHDHVVTTGPLMRVTAPTRTDDSKTFSFMYLGAPEDILPGQRTIELGYDGVAPIPGDLRGRIVSKATLIRGSDGNSQTVPYIAFNVVHKNGPSTPNSFITVDLDAAGLASLHLADRFLITFLNLDTIAEFPLAESDSFVMDYSMTSDTMVNGLKVRRTGTLHIVADDYSVAIVDFGVDLNQDPTGTNFMRIVWSGHIEDRSGSPWVILTCTNASYYPVSITFAGSRWAHSSEE
ncbi:hypothetical protein D3C72_194200 [compost metagenome]